MEMEDAASIIDRFHALYFDRRVQTWGETYWLGHHVLKVGSPGTELEFAL